MSEPVWQNLRSVARQEAEAEPLLAAFLHESVLRHESLGDALATLLAGKLATDTLPAMTLRDLLLAALTTEDVTEQLECDLQAVCDRDPATLSCLQPLLYYKGYHALGAYRAAHYFWSQGRRQLPLLLQSRSSEVFGVDIHPAARIGCGMMIDHATSVVIGETAVVGDDVSLLHEVTLGGTGKQTGDRHPKVERGVLIGAGAKVLGNIRIGEASQIGAGSVVLQDVPPHTTVAGVPARPLAATASELPSLDMDQDFTRSLNSPTE